jgi:glycosyltransferase involved in cell wall biosynthesis
MIQRFGKLALVQDALPLLGGAEKVLETILEVVPDASIYALVHEPRAFRGTVFDGREIRTSPLNRFPLVRRLHRTYLPLYPWAVEQLDVRGHDIVMSLSYAAAHGVLVRPDQLHIAYVYTPLRHAWHATQEFLESLTPARRALAGWLLHRFRVWDQAAAARVDHFVAISHWIARAIRRAYGREAQVIYPPVDVEAFEPMSPRRDYYVALTRLVRHKRVDVLIRAFAQLPHPLLVIGDGPERERLAAALPPNVELLGRKSDAELRELLGRARGLVHAAEEDFGIGLVEAQAAGCPVVAYAGGGALETVLPGRTGLLFPSPTPEAVAAAVRELEERRHLFHTEALVDNAKRFARSRFKLALAELLERQWAAFRSRDRHADGSAATSPTGPA